MAMTGGKAYLVKSAKTNYGKGNDTTYLYLYVKEHSQSISNNQTTLKVGMYITSTYAIGSWTDFNGSYVGTATSGSGCHSFNGTVPYGSGVKWLTENQTFTVTHNSNGTKTVRLYWKLGVNSPWGQFVNPSGYKDITLTKIPRYATITSAPNFTDNSSPVLKYSNPAGNSVTSLQACISFNQSASQTPNIAYRNITKTGTSYTFEFTNAEQTILRQHLTSNPPSGTVYFHIKTVIGNNTSYDSVSKTLTIDETATTKPTVSLSVASDNGTIGSAFNGLYIQGISKVVGTVTASGKYNASISSYSTSIEGKTKTGSSFNSNVLSNSGTQEVKTTVTDSRGFKNTDTKNITVISYAKPTVAPADNESSIKCYRGTVGGVSDHSSTSVYLKCKRNYSPITSGGADHNFCILRWRYKLSSASWGSQSWNTLIARDSTSTDEFAGILPGVTFDADKSYTIQVGVLDDIGEESFVNFGIPTDDVPLHLGAGGTTVSMGGYTNTSDPYSIFLKWKVFCDKDIRFNVDGTNEHRLIKFLSTEGTYPHNCHLYGGWSESMTGIGLYDETNDRFILRYNDVNNVLHLGDPNCTVQINENNVNDMVVSEGTSGIWTYRKWSSGAAECWGTWTGTLTHYTTVNGFYAYYTSVSFPTNLFNATPVPTYSAGVGSVFAFSGNLGSLSKTAMNCYALASSGGSQSVKFCIHANGTWK